MPTFVVSLQHSILFSLLTAISLIFLILILHAPPPFLLRATKVPPTSLTRHNILFSIASSSTSFPKRKPYLKLWHSPTTRAVVFLDRRIPISDAGDLPKIIISGDTSIFPYTFPKGLKSAIRIARIVKETVEKNTYRDVRWFVFGDDDTVFVPDNLIRVLSKYDDRSWYYVGGSSEIYEQNAKNSFEMAFGGAGFAISSSLAKVLARVFDSCLVRYGHLYGSDARVYACVAELGVGLTREAGFHQVDVRGNLFGVLMSHPLSPLLSLHHLDYVDPIFPNMTRVQALQHLFEAVHVDPSRILQQTVCYDQSTLSTVSISWGYAIQVYEGNKLLPDLLSLQKTFMPWTRSKRVDSSHYMFKTREFSKDLCERPAIFFMESVGYANNGVWSNYTRHVDGNCSKSNAFVNVKLIRVFSHKLDANIEEDQEPLHCTWIGLLVIESTSLMAIANSTEDLVSFTGRILKRNDILEMHIALGIEASRNAYGVWD